MDIYMSQLSLLSVGIEIDKVSLPIDSTVWKESKDSL